MKRMIAMISALIVFLGAAFFMTQKPTVSKAKIPTVGILQLMSHPALDQIHKGIIAGLKDEGYIQGKNLKVVFRNAENDQSNLKTMSQTLVERANSDVVVGIATPSAQALANTTTKTPIVLGAVTDPVGSKLVKSETHPGGQHYRCVGPRAGGQAVGLDPSTDAGVEIDWGHFDSQRRFRSGGCPPLRPSREAVR